jgi:hypothetical protein
MVDFFLSNEVVDEPSYFKKVNMFCNSPSSEVDEIQTYSYNSNIFNIIVHNSLYRVFISISTKS